MAADRRINSWMLMTFLVSNGVKSPQFYKDSNPVPLQAAGAEIEVEKG
jgi:hypothetical protein